MKLIIEPFLKKITDVHVEPARSVEVMFVLPAVTSGITLFRSFYAITEEMKSLFGLANRTSVTNPGCRFMHPELFAFSC
jgi:hypothetical protein